MFDLERAVALWRAEMLKAGVKPRRILDELEAHLREDVEGQMKSGTAEKNAFDIAVRNLGNVCRIRDEFFKSKCPSSAMEKLRIGICAILVTFITMLSTLAILLCFAGYAQRLAAASAVICILMVACGWKYAVPLLPLIASTRLRWVVGLACIACGFIASSVFCVVILPHFAVGPDRLLPGIGLWAVFLIAVFLCAGVGLLLSESQRKAWGMTGPAGESRDLMKPN